MRTIYPVAAILSRARGHAIGIAPMRGCGLPVKGGLQGLAESILAIIHAMFTPMPLGAARVNPEFGAD
jgi:hypothetical protein